MLKGFIEQVLPYIISVLEIMGILIVIWSACKAFLQYIQNTFFKKNYDLQFLFATGLATALEFKMAAEILKTVLVRDIKELIMLGAVIILRALVTILLRFEIRGSKPKKINEENKSNAESK
ncbi:MAG: DUF1622 domain-containing protein [Ruminococcaceae bacterium]|nr:DUF1622 domain-containing protein [Oscillospiraceae bacterium]